MLYRMSDLAMAIYLKRLDGKQGDEEYGGVRTNVKCVLDAHLCTSSYKFLPWFSTVSCCHPSIPFPL